MSPYTKPLGLFGFFFGEMAAIVLVKSTYMTHFPTNPNAGFNLMKDLDKHARAQTHTRQR